MIEPKYERRDYLYRNGGDEEQRHREKGPGRGKQRRQIKIDADHDEKNRDEKSEADGFELPGQLSVLRRAQQRHDGSRQKGANNDLDSQGFGEHHKDQQSRESRANFNLRGRMAKFLDNPLQ